MYLAITVWTLNYSDMIEINAAGFQSETDAISFGMDTEASLRASPRPHIALSHPRYRTLIADDRIVRIKRPTTQRKRLNRHPDQDLLFPELTYQPTARTLQELVSQSDQPLNSVAYQVIPIRLPSFSRERN